MKKYRNRVLLLILSIFSFFYTNQIIDNLREKDPLMQEIKNSENKYYQEPINALIEDNRISSGQKGRTIDYNKSYYEMKKYGNYNESLIILKETIPVISIDNNYDKYIIRGNKRNKAVSLVFQVKDNNPMRIISILNKNKVKATFFIDGTFIEKNVNLLKTKKQIFELLSYQNNYQESLFKASISYLETLTNHKSSLCYTEEDNQELLTLCKKLKLHTIKPTIKIKKDAYKEVKENLENAMIISLAINPLIEKELSKVITYIKEKGYQIVPLENLISE